MTVDYRDAGPADAVALAELGARTFIATFGHLYSAENLAAFLVNHTPATWSAILAGDDAVRLAEVDGVAVAYARAGASRLPIPGDRAALDLRQLYVDTGWHGYGVAPVLMAWVIDEARRRGAVDLWLSVFTENHRARAFYKRYGFIEVMPYVFMVGDHADEDILCRLPLDL